MGLGVRSVHETIPTGYRIPKRCVSVKPCRLLNAFLWQSLPDARFVWNRSLVSLVRLEKDSLSACVLAADHRCCMARSCLQMFDESCQSETWKYYQSTSRACAEVLQNLIVPGGRLCRYCRHAPGTYQLSSHHHWVQAIITGSRANRVAVAVLTSWAW